MTKTILDRIAEALVTLRMRGEVPVRIWLHSDDIDAVTRDCYLPRRMMRYAGLPVTQCAPPQRSRVVAASGASERI